MANNFLKELAKNEVVVPHLNRWFRNSKFPDDITFTIHPNKEGDDAFHPSSDAGACAREIYARRVGDLQSSSVRDSQKTFFVGHYYHAMIQKILVDELGFCDWDVIEKQYHIDRDGWWATGRADIARIRPPGHEKDYLVDIKTMRDADYRQSDLPLSSADKYIRQINLYMDWEGIDDGIILCCQKDSPHAFKEIPATKDKSLVNSIYTKWDTVINAVNEGIPPACDCWDSTRCPVKDLYIESVSNSND